MAARLSSVNTQELLVELRDLIADNPGAVVARHDNGDLTIAFARLGLVAGHAIPLSSALRWSGCEKVASGVWNVPSDLIENAAVPAPVTSASAFAEFMASQPAV